MLRFSSVRLLSVAPDKNGRKIRCLAHRKFLRVRSVGGGGGVVAPFFRNLGGLGRQHLDEMGEKRRWTNIVRMRNASCHRGKGNTLFLLEYYTTSSVGYCDKFLTVAN